MLCNFIRICSFILIHLFSEARTNFLDVKVMETEVEIMFENAAQPWSKPDGTGYANDIVVAAFQEVGVTVKKLVVPYARCKKMALLGKIPACVSMTWLPEFKGLIELAPEPLIILNSDIFENMARPLPRAAMNQCKLPAGLAVGVVNAYEYPKETMALKPQTKNWVASGSDIQSLQRLALGRLDAAVVITNDLERRNQKAITAQVEDRVGFAFNCGEQTGTIGFSLKSPKGNWARDLYKEGYRRLKEKGQLDKIHQKWMAKI